MAKNETKPVAPDVLKADAETLAAIKKLSSYAPAKADYSVATLDTAQAALKTAADAFAQAEADWQTARDNHVAAQWEFHNGILGAKQQVIAQYGDDSNEAQAVGLTKKSEYAPRSRKTPPAK